jgi:hypothetical protein
MVGEFSVEQAIVPAKLAVTPAMAARVVPDAGGKANRR